MAKKLVKSGSQDFANRALIKVTETAAGEVSHQRLVTGVSLFERAAFIIHRIGVFIGRNMYQLIVAQADSITAALSTAETSSLDQDNPNIPFLVQFSQDFVGTPASVLQWTAPLWWNFEDLPGGGLLLPATNLFGSVQGDSLASALTISLHLWYTPIQLEPDEYWQLVESTRMLSAP